MAATQARLKCVETVETGRDVSAVGEDDVVRRWPDFGRAMSAGGLHAVHAIPMRWHGHVLGGMNLVWRTPKTLTKEERRLARGFADISALALMQAPATGDPAEVADRLRVALQGRVVIERAKGVLAQTEHLAMDDAFARLMQLSERTERPLAQVAESILNDIVAPRH